MRSKSATNTAANVMRGYRRQRKAEMQRNAESHDYVNGVCCRCEAVAGTVYAGLNDCYTIFGLVHCSALFNRKMRNAVRKTLRESIRELEPT